MTARPSRTVPALLLLTLLAGALLLPARALAVNDDPVLRRMDAVLEENARLREEAWKSRKNGREAAQQAEAALDASEERVEKTRTEALAHVAGVSPAQVESLRKEGKSWGQAAGELGVHPGFLGVGKVPMYESLPKRKAPAEEAQGKPGRGRKKGKAEPAAKGASAKKGKDEGPKAGAKKSKPAAKPEKSAQPEKPEKTEKKAKKAKKSKKAKKDEA